MAPARRRRRQRPGPRARGRTAGGALNVLIDNTDPGNSYTVSLTYSGFTPSGSPTVYTFAAGANSITSASQSSAASVTVGPYSLTDVHVPGSGGTVPPPANSSCAVHYVVNSSWPGGFNASVTMTNNGSAAINPWTLTFTFPAGGTVSIGFNGNNSGQTTPPAAFFVNGTVCANN